MSWENGPMYNPKLFQVESPDEAFELMERNPFATVVSVADGAPFVSHLPLTPKKSGDQIVLIGHLARANPHWKLLPQSQTLAIFHGPHTYITPKWYAENDVPTWNYSVVHATGQVELIETFGGIIECLKELTAHTERRWPSGWDFFVPSDLTEEVLPKSIVGFQIKVDSINFKRKLSQNRTSADRLGILKGLETRSDESSRAVLADMLNIYTPSGEPK